MLSTDSMNRLKYAVASNSAGTEIANAINTPIPNMDGGTVYYVNSAVTASGDGSTWGAALKTIKEAVTLAVAGDTILIQGSFSEVVTVSVAGVSIIGVGTGPKMAQWTSAVDTASLTLAANYCRIQNIYFKPPAYSASTTYGPSAILLSSAGWAYIVGCRFQGQTASYQAIYSPVCNSDNVHILGNEFYYLNTATTGCAILGLTAGGLSYSGWQIRDNVIASCLRGIILPARACTLVGNTIAEYGVAPSGSITQLLTMGIDLSGTAGGANALWANQLGGTYNATLYKVGASGDQWGGNFNVITGGVTAANPA